MPMSRRVLLLATIIACAAGAPIVSLLYAPAAWPLDATQHAVGRDFINVWAAGKLLLEGQGAVLFDAQTYNAALRRLLDPAVQPHFWSYPPTSFLLALPFGLLPYGWSLALWTIAGLAALLAAGRIHLSKEHAGTVTILLLIAPATINNVICGQNGFLTAALLAGGLLNLTGKPVFAGVLLGLLSYKPQFGIVLVPALIALGAWRAIVAATLTATALVLLSVVAFGLEPWRLFLANTVPNQADMLEAFKGFFTYMLVSPYSGLRHLGLGHGAAMTLQGVLCLGVVASVATLARRARDSDALLALVGTATFVASPYSLTYDLPILALIIARRAALQPDWTLQQSCILGAVWAVPLLTVPWLMSGVPVTPVLLCVAFAMTCKELLEADAPVHRRAGPIDASEPTRVRSL